MLGNAALARDERFASGPARQSNRDAMHAEIDAVFSQLTSAQVTARLDAAGIANARLNSMEEFWNHPQLRARGRWAQVPSPAGTLELLKPPLNLQGIEPRLDPVPGLGEHSAAILRELGYADAAIDEMRRDGVI